MGCFASNPPQRDPSGEFTDFVNAYSQAMPDLYAAESQYRPLYAGLDLREMAATLFGQPEQEVMQWVDTPTGRYERKRDGNGRYWNLEVVDRSLQPVTQGAQPGLLDIYGQALPQIQQLGQQSRAGEIADVAALGPAATAAFKAANPDQAALLDMLNKQAMNELAMGAELDPSLARQVQQSVRGAQAARGMGYGPADVYQETYASGLKAEQLRRARQQFAQQMVGINAATTVDPFMAILGRPSQSSTMTQGFMGQSQGVNAAAGPNMFNPMNDYMSDLFNSNFNADAAARIAGSNNQAAFYGSVIGGMGGMAGAAMACWVAREVYGPENPRWLLFRTWLLTRAPAWFRGAYLRWGPAVAGWLRGKDRTKNLIRLWMDRRIATLT